MTSFGGIPRHLRSQEATTLLDYLSDLCEEDRSCGWTLGWCAHVEYMKDPRAIELQNLAEGRWIDVADGGGENTGFRYIPNVRFVFFDECQHCHARKGAHAADGKCLFDATTYQLRSIP